MLSRGCFVLFWKIRIRIEIFLLLDADTTVYYVVNLVRFLVLSKLIMFLVDMLLEVLEQVGYGDSFFYKLREFIHFNRFKLMFIGWDLKHFGLQIIDLGVTELFMVFHEGLNGFKVDRDFRMVDLELIDDTFIQFTLVFHFLFNSIQ